MTAPRLRRRGWMQLASAAGAGWALSGPSRVLAQQIGFDQQRTVADMLQSLIGANLVREQGVSLSVAALADNGTLVPVTVDVTSPMTEQDHVSHIYLLSLAQPGDAGGGFFFGPVVGPGRDQHPRAACGQSAIAGPGASVRRSISLCSCRGDRD